MKRPSLKALVLGMIGIAGVAASAQAAPALQVVDSQGLRVGDLISSGVVARNFSGYWLQFNADRTGFLAGGAEFLFTTPDCSDQPYIQANTLPIITAIDSSNTLYFPQKPFVTLTVLSFLTPSGCKSTNSQVLVGAVQTFDLNSLGLVPPFHVTAR